MVFQKSIKLSVARGKEAELRLLPALPLFDLLRDAVYLLKRVSRAIAKPSVDNVHIVDGVAPEHQRQPNMPIRLQAGTEDGEGMDTGAFEKQTRGRKGGPKGCQCLRVEEANGRSFGRIEG